MVVTGQEMIRDKKKFFQVKEKSGNFILSQGKLIFWRKVRKNWNDLTRENNLTREKVRENWYFEEKSGKIEFNAADLVPLKAERNNPP